MGLYWFVLTELDPNDYPTRKIRRKQALDKAAACKPPITPVTNGDGLGDVNEGKNAEGAHTYTWTVNDPSDLNIYALVHNPLTNPPTEGVFESFGFVACTLGPTRLLPDEDLAKLHQVFEEARRIGRVSTGLHGPAGSRAPLSCLEPHGR
jgi:hypothetical protein